MQVSPGRNYATGSYDYAMSILSGSSPRQLYAEVLAVDVGCGSFEVSWLRCEDMAVAVSGVVDAFVLAAEVEAPVVLEVAGGDEGAELEDGLGAFESPSCARYVHSVLDDVPAGPFYDPGGDGPA